MQLQGKIQESKSHASWCTSTPTEEIRNLVASFLISRALMLMVSGCLRIELGIFRGKVIPSVPWSYRSWKFDVTFESTAALCFHC